MLFLGDSSINDRGLSPTQLFDFWERAAVALAVAGAIGCTASVQGSWQKPDADAQQVGRDTSTCRAIARGEAAQKYPDRGGSPAPFGVPSAWQRDDLSRSTYEVARFESCMQGLGYRRV